VTFTMHSHFEQRHDSNREYFTSYRRTLHCQGTQTLQRWKLVWYDAAWLGDRLSTIRSNL